MDLEFSPNGRHVVVEIRGKFQTKILFSRLLITESPKNVWTKLFIQLENGSIITELIVNGMTFHLDNCQ